MSDREILCTVHVGDGRCPDGCCGEISVSIQSPKTGKYLVVPKYVLAAAQRDALPYVDRTDFAEPGALPSATLTLGFTVPELRRLLAHECAYVWA